MYSLSELRLSALLFWSFPRTPEPDRNDDDPADRQALQKAQINYSAASPTIPRGKLHIPFKSFPAHTLCTTDWPNAFFQISSSKLRGISDIVPDNDAHVFWIVVFFVLTLHLLYFIKLFYILASFW